MCSLAMCDFSGDGNLEVKYVNIADSQLIILFNTTIYSALKRAVWQLYDLFCYET